MVTGKQLGSLAGFMSSHVRLENELYVAILNWRVQKLVLGTDH